MPRLRLPLPRWRVCEQSHCRSGSLHVHKQYQLARAFSSSHTLGHRACSRNFSHTALIQRAVCSCQKSFNFCGHPPPQKKKTCWAYRKKQFVQLRWLCDAQLGQGRKLGGGNVHGDCLGRLCRRNVREYFPRKLFWGTAGELTVSHAGLQVSRCSAGYDVCRPG